MPNDIIALLVALFSDNWTPSNTAGITPQILVGHTEGEGGPHRVLVNNVPSEDATGTSGIAGIGGGGGIVQVLRGMAFVDCIAVVGDGLPDPDRITNLFTREVQRILIANVTSVAGYDYVSFLGYNRVPPQQGGVPFKIRRSCKVGFQWRIAG